MTVRLVVASRNAKKLAELRRVLESAGIVGIEPVGLDEVPEYSEEPEDGATFADNALIKARSGALATGLPCLADDSGLAVDALNGMPGVLSARWAGPAKDDTANNRLLLAQLAEVPDERRGAHFACAVALVHPDGRELVVHGRMAGRILRELRGSGGFGYDVLFVADEHANEGPDGTGLTSAELDPSEKDRISHRGRALRELAPQVAGILA